MKFCTIQKFPTILYVLHFHQLVDTDVIHVIKYTRPSPSSFVYCKQSKTGWWEGLE